MSPSEPGSLGTSLSSDVQALVDAVTNQPGTVAAVLGLAMAVLFAGALAAGWVHGRFFRKDPRRDRLMQRRELKRQGFLE
jgi:hypothetical protein